MSNNHKIDYGNGQVSYVDARTFNHLKNLHHAVDNPKKLPKFYDLFSSIGLHEPRLIEFYSYCLAHHQLSKSQLYQDLFVLFMSNNMENGRFLEFGATDGLELSNSFLLEANYGWQGVLAEPSPQWHDSLRKNRPDTKILTECVYSESGKELDFFVSDVGVLSTLEDFRESDKSSMAGNTAARNKSGYSTKVSTISLNDLFIEHFDSKPIDYMSVDTEGSELQILEKFNFEKYGPKYITVEHNFTDHQALLDKLLEENGYSRMFGEYSQFDAWYMRNS